MKILLGIFLFKYLSPGLRQETHNKCSLPESSLLNMNSKCSKMQALQWIITCNLPPPYILSTGRKKFLHWGLQKFIRTSSIIRSSSEHRSALVLLPDGQGNMGRGATIDMGAWFCWKWWDSTNGSILNWRVWRAGSGHRKFRRMFSLLVVFWWWLVNYR